MTFRSHKTFMQHTKNYPACPTIPGSTFEWADRFLVDLPAG